MTAACQPEEATAPNGSPSVAAPSANAVIENDATPEVAQRPAAGPGPAIHPCLVQDGERLEVGPVKALGTEPFWAARTEGRCVTYSTPEDQKGTRIWTRVESGPNGPVWNGAFNGKRFQLYVQPMPDCSDGMSDKRYPLSARLLVDGEQRTGCAEPSGAGR